MNTGVWRLFDDLRMLRVVVIHPPGEDRGVREEQLRRIGCPARTVWPFPAQLSVHADVIFFLVDPELRSAGNWCAVDTEATLIALSDYENPTALKLLVDTQEHGVIASTTADRQQVQTGHLQSLGCPAIQSLECPVHFDISHLPLSSVERQKTIVFSMVHG